MPAPSPRPFPLPHLLAVSFGEMLVVLAAVLRLVVVPGSVDFAKTAHVAWFGACFALAGLAPATFVIRSSMLSKRERAGEDVADERKQVLVMSLALLLPPAVIAFAGPAMVELVLK